MSVRVALSLTALKGSPVRSGPIETSAVVNSGYEAGTAELLVPLRLAAELHLDPASSPDAEVSTYDTAGGSVQVARFEGGARVDLLADGNVLTSSNATVVVSDVEQEALINDSLAEALRIVILAPRAGTWALATDPPGTRRASVPTRLW